MSSPQNGDTRLPVDEGASFLHGRRIAQQSADILARFFGDAVPRPVADLFDYLANGDGDQVLIDADHSMG